MLVCKRISTHMPDNEEYLKRASFADLKAGIRSLLYRVEVKGETIQREDLIDELYALLDFARGCE